MATAPTRPQAFAAFSHRNFVRFTSARFLSLLATQIVSVAVAWQVYALTESPLALGYVGLAQFLPACAFSLLSGYAADRFPRKRLLLICQSVLLLCVVLLLSATMLGWRDVRPVYGVLALMGTARAFRDPASQSLLPDLIPLTHFNNAISWSSSFAQVARVLGPALGGLLYGASQGPQVAYGCAAALLAITLLLFSGLRVDKTATDAPKFELHVVLDGLRYVWRQKPLLGAISLDLFAVLFGGAVALLPVYCKEVLHVGPTGLGMLRSAPAVGAGLTAVALAYHPFSRSAGKWMFGAVAIFGLATIAFGLSRSFSLSLGLLALLGAADMVSVNIRLTLEQLMTPQGMRGRVSAINWLFINASNELGEFESGLTAAWFGTVPAVVIGGLATLGCVVVWSVLFPGLRKLERVDAPAA